MKMFKSRGGSTEEKMDSKMKSMDGVFGGEHKKGDSHKAVKGSPMPGHATSSMEKGKHEVSETGEKKYKSNTMSPGCREGKANEYGKG